MAASNPMEATVAMANKAMPMMEAMVAHPTVNPMLLSLLMEALPMGTTEPAPAMEALTDHTAVVFQAMEALLMETTGRMMDRRAMEALPMGLMEERRASDPTL